MATLENVSVEDLRQILAEVDDADATKRLMAAITYKEIDELTQTEAAQLYGFPVVGPRNGSTDSNGSPTSRSRRSSTTNHVRVDPPNSPTKSTSSSSRHFINLPRKPDSTHPHGLCHSRVTTSSKNSASSSVNATSDG